MLLNSPLFLFLFLPLSLGIYAIVPKAYRREALFLFSVFYYLMANIANPFAILIISMYVVFVWGMCYIISRVSGWQKKLFLAVSLLIVVSALIFMRKLLDYGANPLDVYYPLGMAIWSLASISCLVDVYRRDAISPGLFDCALYLTFYPVMIAGPIIKFKDSKKLFSEIEFCFENLASGARFFMIGFIKRIAVGAVLFEAYQEIVARSGKELTPLVVLVLFLILATDIYAVFSGYSDMATGVALMYGIKLRENFGNPLTAGTPNQYIKKFMITLYEFAEDYILKPICGNNNKSVRGIIGITLSCEFFIMWYRTDWRLFLLSIPALMLVALIFITDFTEIVNKRLWSRILGRIITFICMAVVWLMIRMSNPFLIFEYKIDFTSPMRATQLLTLFGSASAFKYIMVLIFGLLVLMPATKFGKYIRRRMKHGIPTWINIMISGAIMLGFMFTILVFMPQYPKYATDALGGLLS